jgi:hypothetical protein
MTYPGALIGLLAVGSACAQAGDDATNPDARLQSGADGSTSGADGPSLIDARIMVDARPAVDGMVSTSCTTMSSWGDQGPVDGDAFEEEDALGVYRKIFAGPMETTPVGDHFVVDLWEGYGVFASGYRTGTFTLGGADAVWESCGLCIRIEADYDGGPTFNDHYMGQTGSVTLTSVNGRLTGSITNVTFRHITVSGETSSNHPDGCTTTITSATFDELIL